MLQSNCRSGTRRSLAITHVPGAGATTGSHSVQRREPTNRSLLRFLTARKAVLRSRRRTSVATMEVFRAAPIRTRPRFGPLDQVSVGHRHWTQCPLDNVDGVLFGPARTVATDRPHNRVPFAGSQGSIAFDTASRNRRPGSRPLSRAARPRHERLPRHL